MYVSRIGLSASGRESCSATLRVPASHSLSLPTPVVSSLLLCRITQWLNYRASCPEPFLSDDDRTCTRKSDRPNTSHAHAPDIGSLVVIDPSPLLHTSS